jgi:3-polyprenyl-4-hydroxybenzoate decarboxylase
MQRIIIGISGASGAIYGIRALEALKGRARHRDSPCPVVRRQAHHRRGNGLEESRRWKP